MENYLQGYLDVLPGSERKRIEDVLRENQNLLLAANVTESQFGEIIRQLTEEHTKLIEHVPQDIRLDPDAYNRFFGNLYADLMFLFLESNLIERATQNYDRIYEGIIREMEREIKALRERVNSLRLVSEGEDGLIVRSYTFDTKSEMETDTEMFGHLFTDRNGKAMPMAVIETNHDQSYLVLSKDSEKDHLRNDKGEVVATIEVIDRRGIDGQNKSLQSSQYPIGNAIDNSTDTYWGEVILSDQPVNVPIRK